MACWFGVAGPAYAQAPIAPATRRVPFARYLPSTTNLFVQVHELSEVDEALSRAHAWRFLPLVAGATIANAETTSLRAATTKLLGPRSSITIDDLSTAEMGVVVPSWSNIDSATWFVRIPDQEILDRWLPQDGQRATRTAAGVRFFRTPGGVFVWLRDDVAVLGHTVGKGSVLREVVALMRGAGGSTLAESTEYRMLTSQLPARPLAVAYVAPSAPEPPAEVRSSLWWPAIERAAVGMYEGGGRLDFALRASLRAPHGKERLSRMAVRRLLRLPQTTLLAAALTVDFEQAVGQARSGSSSGNLARYLTTLEALRGPASARPQPPPRIGPNVIVAWGQDLGEHGGTPQVALMVEGAPSRALRDETTRVAQNLLQLLSMIDPADESFQPKIKKRVHLGTEILSVPLADYAEHSRFPVVRLFKNLEPSWATVGNWLVVALTRQQLERILDAQNGLLPTLSAARDVRGLDRRTSESMMLAMARAGLATDVLSRWLKDFEAGKTSLLDPLWWRPAQKPEELERQQLGVHLEARPGTGTVIASLSPQASTADGPLQPGDVILAVDGHVLDLNDPHTDLRERLTQSTAKPGPTLRVQRGTTALDVPLPRSQRIARTKAPALEPADAVRELIALGQTLQFAVFTVQATQPEDYSAHLTLRFAP